MNPPATATLRHGGSGSPVPYTLPSNHPPPRSEGSASPRPFVRSFDPRTSPSAFSPIRTPLGSDYRRRPQAGLATGRGGSTGNMAPVASLQGLPPRQPVLPISSPGGSTSSRAATKTFSGVSPQASNAPVVANASGAPSHVQGRQWAPRSTGSYLRPGETLSKDSTHYMRVLRSAEDRHGVYRCALLRGGDREFRG